MKILKDSQKKLFFYFFIKKFVLAKEDIKKLISSLLILAKRLDLVYFSIFSFNIFDILFISTKIFIK